MARWLPLKFDECCDCSNRKTRICNQCMYGELFEPDNALIDDEREVINQYIHWGDDND